MRFLSAFWALYLWALLHEEYSFQLYLKKQF